MKKSVIVIIVVIVAGSGIGFLIVSNKNASSADQKSTPANGINYDPATAQDKAYSQTKKQASLQGSQGSSTDTTPTDSSVSQGQGSQPPKAKVYPVITTYYQSNGTLTVNGFVQGVVESGGTCTLVLTKQGVTVQQTHQGAVNASTTTCGGIGVPLSKLSPGAWQATLSYSSAKYKGTSSPTSITVQ